MPPLELQHALENVPDDQLEALHDDLKSSYRLAMEAAGCTAEQITKVTTEVDDYVGNTWF